MTEEVQPIWQYRSNPTHTLNWDVGIRTILDPFSQILGDGIIAHHYDWLNIPYRQDYQGNVISGDPSVFPRRTLLGGALVDTRWGWQTAYVMGIDLEKTKGLDGWHFAYHFRKEDQTRVDFDAEREIRKCRIIIPPQEQVRFLIGDKPVSIFALDLQDRELPVKLFGPIHRRDPKFRHWRLV